MFGGEGQLILVLAQVEERIEPGVQIGASPEGVTFSGAWGNVLSGMVDL